MFKKPLFVALSLLSSAVLAVGAYSTFAWYSVKVNISVSSQTVSISTAAPDMGSLTFDSAYLLKPLINGTYSTLTVENGAFTDLNAKLQAAHFAFDAVSTSDGQQFATKYPGYSNFTTVDSGYVQFAIKARFDDMSNGTSTRFKTNIDVTMGSLTVGGQSKPRWLRMHVIQTKSFTLANPTPYVAIINMTSNQAADYIDGAIFANEFPNNPKGYDSATIPSRLEALNNTYVCGVDTAVTDTGNSAYHTSGGYTWYIFSLYLEGTVDDDMDSLPAQNISFSISLTGEKVR